MQQVSLAATNLYPKIFLGETGLSTGSFHLLSALSWWDRNLAPGKKWRSQNSLCHTLKEERSMVWKCCRASLKEISCAGWSIWLPVAKGKRQKPRICNSSQCQQAFTEAFQLSPLSSDSSCKHQTPKAAGSTSLSDQAGQRLAIPSML